MRLLVVSTLIFASAGCNLPQEEKKPTSKPTPVQPAAPQPAPPATPVKKDLYEEGEVYSVGGVNFSVVHPRVGAVQVSAGGAAAAVSTKQAFLLIPFKVVNTGTAPFAYQHPGKDEVRLTDDLGNSYKNEDELTLDVRGKVKTALIQPNASISDFIAFDVTPLTADCKRLLVEFLGVRFNGPEAEVIKFSIRAPGK
jgi:hypothetical protein